MKFHKLIFVSVFFPIVCFSFNTWAAIETAETRTLLMDAEPLQEGSVWGNQVAPFLGLGLGYMDENEELKTKGVPANIKLIGSLFPAPGIVYDIGAGLMTQTFSNQSDKDTVISGIIDSSLRFRLGSSWQLGPQVKTYIGHGDEFGSSTDLLTTFVGLQAMREQILFGKFRNRAGLSFTTDIGIPNQTAFVTSLEFQFSLLNEGSQTVGAVPVKVEDIPVSNEPALPQVKEAISTGIVYFELNQSRLQNDASLQAFQSQNPEKLKYVEIVGYADSTGGEGLNLKISRDRARSVREALVRAGVPSDKIQVRWVGEAEAIEDQKKQPELRKVDIKFVETESL